MRPIVAASRGDGGANGNERATRTDPIYTQADWSGIGSGIANALGQVFGFGGSPGPQAQQAPKLSRRQAASRQSSRKRFNHRARRHCRPQAHRWRPARHCRLQGPLTSAKRRPRSKIDLPTFDVSASPYAVEAGHPNTVAGPQCSTTRRRGLDPGQSAARLDPNAAALSAAASIPVQAASAPPAEEGPWTKYQTAQPSTAPHP